MPVQGGSGVAVGAAGVAGDAGGTAAAAVRTSLRCLKSCAERLLVRAIISTIMRS